MSNPSPASDAVPFSALVNKDFITPRFGPGERVDPFWGMVWPNSDGGPVLAWRSLESEQALADAGIRVTSRPSGRRHTRTQDEAISLLNKRRSRLITLGAINLWRTVTGEQLAAITGQSGLASPTSDVTGLLFDGGLIQRSRAQYAGRALDTMPEVFRPAPQAGKMDLRQHLRFKDWMGVTLGTPPLQGHQYDRHNLLATELSLRAAEICPIRSVLGESAAGWPRLFDSKMRPNPHRSADAVWIREDGLKIALELTNAVTPATVTKIEQLAELLARDTSRSVVFLFVVAAQPRDERTSDVAKRLRQAIKKSSHSSRSRILGEVEKRLTIARWESWFPAKGLVSRDFIPLRAQRYVAAEDDWVDTDLLDPYSSPFDGAGSYALEETSRNLNDVYGVPHWMRTGPGFDFDALLIEKAGFGKVLEIRAASNRDRSQRAMIQQK